MASNEVKELVLRLHDIGAFKFGEFTLKSGIKSPIYIDLRVIVSFPDVLQSVAREIGKLTEGLQYDVICGVPYTALPIATVLSVQKGKAMVMRRKEVKNYGLRKVIEGVFSAGQTCLVIEDLVTSGLSVFETVAPLAREGLKVTDVVVLVDREQGGRANLSDGGLRLHAVLSLSSVLDVLVAAGRLSAELAGRVREFITANQLRDAEMARKLAAEAAAPQQQEEKRECVAAKPVRQSYGARAALAKNAVARRLLEIMERKKTNLCLSADVTRKAELLRLADAVGPYICVLKTHIDIIEDFDQDLITQLRALADKHGFLIFEDRKFADIGNTAMLQYSRGIYRIAEWADIVNAHTVPGPGVIKGLREVGLAKGRALLLLAEMSSEGTLATGEYTARTVEMAEQNSDFVMGFIAQRRLSSDPGLLTLTPGVALAQSREGDKLGQQYNTPEAVICGAGCDVIIVGRAILNAPDPVAAAQLFRKQGWDAYEKSLAASATA